MSNGRGIKIVYGIWQCSASMHWRVMKFPGLIGTHGLLYVAHCQEAESKGQHPRLAAAIVEGKPGKSAWPAGFSSKTTARLMRTQRCSARSPFSTAPPLEALYIATSLKSTATKQSLPAGVWRRSAKATKRRGYRKTACSADLAGSWHRPLSGLQLNSCMAASVFYPPLCFPNVFLNKRLAHAPEHQYHCL